MNQPKSLDDEAKSFNDEPKSLSDHVICLINHPFNFIHKAKSMTGEVIYLIDQYKKVADEALSLNLEFW